MNDSQTKRVLQESGLSGLVLDKLLKGRIAVYCVIVAVIAIFISVFHFYMGFFGLLPALLVRPIHVVLFMMLIFLYPTGSIENLRLNSKTVFKNILPAVATLSVGIYYVTNYYELMLRGQSPVGWDYFFGVLFIIGLLEATRRSVGIAVPLISICFLFYAFEGRLFPGALAHGGFSLHRVIGFLFLSGEGIFGVIVAAMVSYIVLFVIFGVFLEKTGGDEFFKDLSNSLAGRSTGGPAKVAVIASGFFGMISGSGVANAATIGSITIPTMKKMGFDPVFAGAVEAVASSGGQIMPPVMGAAAFIMAEILGIPYIKICLYSALPAVLYYVAAYATVHFEAKRRGLLGMPKGQLPNLKLVVLSRGFLFIPVFLLVYLLVRGYSPMLTVVFTISLLIILSMFKKLTRLNFRKIVSALELGAKNTMGVAAISACAGIIAGMINMTGLSASMSSFLVEISQGNVYVVLFLTMVVAIILGMGMPTVAVYVILVVLMAPALTELGIPEFISHLYVFYYGIASGLTPPVCTVAYTAAAISGASPVKTGYASSRLGIAIFLLPWAFIFNHHLVLWGNPLFVVVSALAAFVGCWFLAAGLQGWFNTRLNYAERAAAVVGGAAMFYLSIIAYSIGVILMIFVLRRQNVSVKTLFRLNRVTPSGS